MFGSNTFRKRKGTTSVGKDYEDVTIASLILNFLQDETIDNFKISSNDARFGDFDDIVFEIESNNMTQLFALQLKHNMNQKFLRLESIVSKSGDFSYDRYYQSFKELENIPSCSFILYTNRKFSNFVGVQEDHIHTNIIRIDGFELFKNGHCYIIDSKSANVNEKEFLKTFYLYTDQYNVEETKENVILEFEKMFLCTILEAENFLQFIAKWSKQDGTKNILDKKFISEVIALILFTPYIKPILFGGEINENMKILQTILSESNVAISEELFENWNMIWSDCNREVTEADLGRMCRKYELNSTLYCTLNKVIWLMNKCPLVVHSNPTTLKAMSLCKDKKFIFLSSDIIKDPTIVQNLSQMDKQSMLTENFECQLQGKEKFKLKHLIQNCKKSDILFTTNELVKMLKQPLKIGDERKQIQQPYINRLVSEDLISFEYLKKMKENTLIVLNTVNKFDKVRGVLGNFNLIKVERYLEEKHFENQIQNNLFDLNDRKLFHTSPILKHYVPDADIFMSCNQCTIQEFEETCELNPTYEQYHFFQLISEDTLRWITSRKSIDDLAEFRTKSQSTIETDLYKKEFPNNINLICGDPGMGKSELLKNIYNNYHCDVWTVFLSAQFVDQICESIKQAPHYLFVSLLLDTKYKSCSTFEQELFKLFVQYKKVAYFWDGLDEVSSENLSLICQLIEDLKEESAFQWISARSHLKKFLEQRFTILAFTLNQFSDEEQRSYIFQKLSQSFPPNCIENIIGKIRSTVTLIKQNEILGIPLQISMLTELFLQDHTKYLTLLDKMFSLTDLYRHIIEQKFAKYYTEKALVTEPNHELKSVLNSHKKLMFEKYEHAGLKSLIQQELFKHMNINYQNFLEDGSSDGIGLIREVTNNFPQFLHTSYAEYFVAHYLIQHNHEIKDIEQILCNKRYTNIKFFYDLLSATDSSAHIAVLYKNLQLLKEHNNLKCRDKDGRDLIQLACSWGEKYKIFNVVENEGVYILDTDIDDSGLKDSSEYVQILEYLLENAENSNWLSYVEATDCLLAKLTILLKQNILKLQNDSQGITLLYYSIKFGYDKIVNLFDNVPLVKTKTSRSTLLHVAVNYNQARCLKALLSFDIYKKEIDCQDASGRTALHRACQQGSLQLSEILLKSKADPNVGDNLGLTPLHTTSLHRQDNIVKLLLDFGAAVNAEKQYSITSLHLACWNGHASTTKLLLNHCANVNALTTDGESSLYVASRNNHPATVQVLLEFGADVNLSQKDAVTPLIVAAQEGHEKNVELLLEAAADVNFVTKTGESALFVASQNGHVNVVEMLISFGADCSLLTKDEWNPIRIATQLKKVRVLDLFEK